MKLTRGNIGVVFKHKTFVVGTLYFHSQISIANGGGPLWQNVSITAGATTNGGLVFPANSQSLTYDADGNLTFDGIWNYSWDAANRLVSMNMTNISGIAPSNRLRLDFAYDNMNRRVSKVVWTNSTGSTFVPQATNYFIYDGWNLIAVFNPAGTVQQSFLWGNDLSGTMANAGGIGGLLAMANSGTNYFATYDGNGNITGLINGADKSTGARYEYSPLGEALRATGPMAKVNPFRFSTKFCDDESGLVNYGYRYYSPTIGRWLGRDSAGEQKGGDNLFVFCNNSSINFVDNDGRIATAAYWWNVIYTMEKGIAQAEAMGEEDTVERLQGLWSKACIQFAKACANEEAVGGIAEGFDEGTALLGGVAIGPLAVC